MMKTETETTPVVIIGGSLVGLSAAMFFALKKIPLILIEKHSGSALHPRAIGYPSRSMELFDAAGIIDQIPQSSSDQRVRRTVVESLAGAWKEETIWTPAPGAKQKTADVMQQYSPYPGASIAQDRLEPILRERAQQLGADLRLGTELVHFEQDADGVMATVRERDSARTYFIRAQYLLAADGNTSPIRESLGIGRQGHGHLQFVRSVLFRADLEQYLEKGIVQFEIDQPDFNPFLTTYKDGRWVLMFRDDIERDQPALLAAIYRAIGRQDLPVEIITTGRWDLTALITEQFSKGRIFLAGDAAHTLPPTRGGFGANTGIQDVHNLAWKLAQVLAGVSTPQLLQTYQPERHPVAWQRYLQTFARPDYAAYASGDDQQVPIYDDISMEFGQIYRSGAIIGADASLPEAMHPDEWQGQPGTRAAHLWLRQDGERISSLHLLQKGWVLLSEDNQWIDAVTAVQETANQRQLALDIKAIQIGREVIADDIAQFRSLYGLEATGATLIRPDGYIAWRSVDRPAEPEATLREVMRTVNFLY